MLTFEPEDHVYRWNGKVVPNVTRALSLITDYSRIPAPVLKHAQDEGIAIHRTVELYCKDDLDETSLPAWLVPRLAAFKCFVADTGFRLAASEQRVYHPTYGYAGQLDLDGELRLPQARKEVWMPAVIDIKRSFYAGRAIGLQTAAYASALQASAAATGQGRHIARRRYALQLREDGTYRLEPFDDRSDFANFLACLNTYRLKESLHV